MLGQDAGTVDTAVWPPVNKKEFRPRGLEIEGKEALAAIGGFHP